MPLELRDYQTECLQTIVRSYREGVHRQLVCLPTGTGKTVIFAQFPHFLKMKKRMLVLAHRKELLEQARYKLIQSNQGLSIDIEQAGRMASSDTDVVVASIATLGRKNSKRLLALDPGQFSIIVVDEAHHATADSYKRVLDYFGVLEAHPQKLLCGFTATPKRSDGKGLNKIFDEIVFSRNLPEMIRTNYLSPVTGYRVETNVDLSGVKVRMGDFIASQLSKEVNTSSRNEIVVRIFEERLKDRQTLVFCVDIAHAHELAGLFQQHDIKAAAISGETPPDERSDILESFSQGKIQVIANCMVLTEGYDEPTVGGIILARPTKSGLLYTQMIGRGTRLHPGKENVIVIDIADLSQRHSLMTLPTLFGLSSHFDLKGKTTSYIEDAMRWVERNRPWVQTDLVSDIDDLKYRCRHVDLFELQIPDELAEMTQFAWTKMGHGFYRLGLGNGEQLVLEKTLLETWELTLRTSDSAKPEIIAGNQKSLHSSLQKAEGFVRTSRPASLKLVTLGVSWRRQPASEKQLRLIRSKGISVPENITRGQAAHLIAMLLK